MHNVSDDILRWEDDGGAALSLTIESHWPLRALGRERPQIDLTACPWLITRFVDATMVDQDEERSFDAIMRRYDLARNDPALARLALIVRGADADARALTPESRGLLAIAQGFRAAYANQHERIAAELPVYDALYAWCRTQTNSEQR